MSNSIKLNAYLSNVAVLTFKLHNLHWNVTGCAFVQVHEFTEKLYDVFFAQFDEVAEILKMRNEMPLVKLVDFLKNSSIKEIDAKQFGIEETLKIVEADLQEMNKLAREIRDDANKNDDFQVMSIFEGYLEAYAKNLWFLKAMQTK